MAFLKISKNFSFKLKQTLISGLMTAITVKADSSLTFSKSSISTLMEFSQVDTWLEYPKLRVEKHSTICGLSGSVKRASTKFLIIPGINCVVLSLRNFIRNLEPNLLSVSAFFDFSSIKASATNPSVDVSFPVLLFSITKLNVFSMSGMLLKDSKFLTQAELFLISLTFSLILMALTMNCSNTDWL